MEDAAVLTAEAIVHQVETMYAAYSGSFNHGDISQVVRYVSTPYIMTICGDPVVVFATPDSVLHLFEQALAGMKARGWARSDFTIVRIWPMSGKHALLLTDITRSRVDGSVFESGRYLYSVRTGEPNWQITGVTTITPPFNGPGDFPRP